MYMSSTVACPYLLCGQADQSSGTDTAPSCLFVSFIRRGLHPRDSVGVGRSLSQEGPDTVLEANTTAADDTMSPSFFVGFLVAALFMLILVFTLCTVWFITERRKLNKARKGYVQARNEALNPVAKSDASVQCDRFEVRILSLVVPPVFGCSGVTCSKRRYRASYTRCSAGLQTKPAMS